MTIARALVFIAGTALVCGCALAQNALDQGQPNDAAYKSTRGSGRDRQAQPSPASGRALDANSRVGSGGTNETSIDWARELSLRNALVTGNVGGGKAFRGDVGYSDIADFRSSTGADDLFNFERDSASARDVTDPIRGLTGLRLALGQSGNRSPASGDLIVRRSTAGATAAEETVKEGQTNQLTVDPYGNIRGALRSTTDNIINLYSKPRILAKVTQRDDDSDAILVASPLQSVRSLKYSNPQLSWQEMYDPTLPKAPQVERATNQPQNSEPVGQRIEATEPFLKLRESLHKQSEQYLARPYGEAPPAGAPEPAPNDPADPSTGEAPAQETTVQKFDRMLEELRLDLLTRLEEEKKAQEAGRFVPRFPGDREPEPEAPKPGDEILTRANALLDHAPARVEKLLSEAGVSDFYSLHMLRGQEALAQGRFFEAEERFTAALQQQVNDPMASIGRVHAQIGAGLYRSASFNLRSLFSAFPETIPATYDPSLFPAPDRLAAIIATLNDHVTKRRLFARDASFLLAYISHQRGDVNGVIDAFKSMQTIADERGAPLTDLERILKDVWTGRGGGR